MAAHDSFPEEATLIRIGGVSLPEVVAESAEEEAKGPPGRKPQEELQIEGGVRGAQTRLPEAGVQEKEIQLCSVLDGVDQHRALLLKIGQEALLTVQKGDL
jgi:hypothetical protein